MSVLARLYGELAQPPVKREPEQPILGKTLPELLDEACDRCPNPNAFNQFRKGQWQPWSNHAFRVATEEIAKGLLGLGLDRGDRVAFLMRSDLQFALADLACARAGLVSVPITLTETLTNIAFVLNHSEAKVLFISNLDLLYQVVPQLWDTGHLHSIIVVDVPQNWPEERQQKLQCSLGYEVCAEACTSPGECLCLPMFVEKAETERNCPIFPQCIRAFSLAELQAQAVEATVALPVELWPQDLATILYTPVESGELKGVMLSHENLSANALTAFRDSQIAWGANERALSFLPLTHVFARALFYGHLYYGHSLYFSAPSRVMKHLVSVKPTIFATVPLLLEKTYSKLQELSEARPARVQSNPVEPRLRHYFHSLKRRLLPQGFSASMSTRLLAWGLQLAQQYNPRESPGLFYRLQLKLADWLVFWRWRSQFGGKLSIMLCGGAPLHPEVARVFEAAGFPLLQGYGLTQTSSVIAYSRGDQVLAETVGQPAAGAEVKLADDGEVLVRGPFVMQGYFKDEVATQAAIGSGGWFHTGDRGQFDSEGFLSITGSKKSLFKLATGKYVAAEALEREVMRSPLVAHAVAVGRGRKFCGLLVFPDLDALQPHLQGLSSAAPLAQLLKHPEILQRYQAWVEQVNQQFPKWSRAKRLQLVNRSLSLDGGSLKVDPVTRQTEVDRDAISQIFAAEIESLYQESKVVGPRQGVQAVLPPTAFQPESMASVAQQTAQAMADALEPALSTPPLFPMPPSDSPLSS